MGLLRPTVSVERVTDITPALVRAMGADTLLLDVDNTLAAHGSPEPFPGSVDWTHAMRQAGIGIIIVSNNYAERVAPFAEQYGLPFLSRAFKPLPSGYRRAAAVMKAKHRRIVAVGDQIFTDVLGANLCGIKSILLMPVIPETSWSFRVRRYLERPLRRSLDRRGIHLPARLQRRKGEQI